jgi:hypothetical protein
MYPMFFYLTLINSKHQILKGGVSTILQFFLGCQWVTQCSFTPQSSALKGHPATTIVEGHSDAYHIAIEVSSQGGDGADLCMLPSVADQTREYQPRHQNLLTIYHG